MVIKLIRLLIVFLCVLEYELIEKNFKSNDEFEWGCAVNLDEYWPFWSVKYIKKNKHADRLGVCVDWKIVGVNGIMANESTYQDLENLLQKGQAQKIIFARPSLVNFFFLLIMFLLSC